MKLPRSVLEKMAREGKQPPAIPPGGRAHARLDEQRRRRGIDPDAPAQKEPTAPAADESDESSSGGTSHDE